jgi:hypothetical protein
MLKHFKCSKTKSLVDVAIEIDQKTDTILNYFRDYLQLVRMKDLVTIHD